MSNPYGAPESRLSGRGDDADETYVPKIFSLSGRIGRLRYLAYTFGAGCLFLLWSLLAGRGVGIISFVFLLLLPVAWVAIHRRRLNDLDKTGWLQLILFVPPLSPFMALYLTFFPGTDGDNRFGPAPAPNSRGVVASVCLLPLLTFIFLFVAVGFSHW